MTKQQAIQLTITPAAIQHLQEMIAHENGIGLRLSMRKYGCNGYGYVPDVIHSVMPTDIELTDVAELRIFVDIKYQAILSGVNIDYIKKGLGQYQLVFTNPNAEGECGCGESVNFRDDIE